jgi:hypothetical protein
MKRVGMTAKRDYQVKIKPIIKKYNFTTDNYIHFYMDQYKIQFFDDKYNFNRKYFFYKITDTHHIDFYVGYDVKVFVRILEKEMNIYNRKLKIKNILTNG